MPTATSIADFTLLNLGPLTTTFTAPSSCATATASRFGMGIAYAPFYGSLRSEECGMNRYMYTDSDTACYPSASAHNANYMAALAARPVRYPIQYHSPGNACPSGWTTAATMTVGAYNRKQVSFSYDSAIQSVFMDVQSYYRDADFFMGAMPEMSIFVDALGPGETGVACCPSSYSAEPFGRCYSQAPISVYTATTACEVILWPVNSTDQTTRTEVVTIHGETGTAHIVGWPDSAEFTTTTLHYTFSDLEEADALTGHEYVGRAPEVTPRAVVYVETMILLAAGGDTASETTGTVEESATDTAVTSGTSSAMIPAATTGGEENTAAGMRSGLVRRLVGIVAAAAAACVVGF